MGSLHEFETGWTTSGVFYSVNNYKGKLKVDKFSISTAFHNVIKQNNKLLIYIEFFYRFLKLWIKGIIDLIDQKN